MYSEPNAVPQRTASYAYGFAIPPRSSVARLVTFQCLKDASIAPGQYTVILYACIDGDQRPRKTNLSFAVRFTERALRIARRKGGNYICYSLYEDH
jgi:hypothetical protein